MLAFGIAAGIGCDQFNRGLVADRSRLPVDLIDCEKPYTTYPYIAFAPVCASI